MGRPQPEQQAFIAGIKISLLDSREILERVHSAAQRRKRCIVASGNVHACNLAAGNPELRRFINNADLVRLDGAGVALATRIYGFAPPPRMTWADFAFDLAAYASENGLRLFLLGNKPGVAEKAATKLRAAAPGLRIAGTQHGYFAKNPGSTENLEVIRRINTSMADILIVGLGMPLQERWITENAERIETPVIMTAGAAFEWIADLKPRAPGWMRSHGLEWLWRFLLEPKRLFSRYIIGNPRFLIRVLRHRLNLL